MDSTITRISSVANRLGVSAQYLRMLERQGRVPPVAYDRVGRFYTEADITLLRAMGVGSRPDRLKRPEELEKRRLMNSKRSTRSVVVERRYEAQEKECAEAINVLLKRAAGKTSAEDALKLANKERRPA